MREFLQKMSWLALLSFSSFSFSASRDFIVDTDMAVDDAIALVYFLQRPEIQVKAIIIDGNGAAHCEPAFQNAMGLLKMLHHKVIPVACGRLTSLQGTHHYPAAIVQESDTLAGMATDLAGAPVAVSYQGKRLLFKMLSGAHHPLSILALGPLTNIADVIKAHPELKKKIQRIYFMGGAVNVPGNIHVVDPSLTNEKAEWNIFIDPIAAKIVFASGIPMTLVPLDSCQKVAFDADFYHQIKMKHVTPAAQFVYTLLFKNPEKVAAGDWFFWDPLAAYVANAGDTLHCESLSLRVQTTPESQAGNLEKTQQKVHPAQVCMPNDMNIYDLKYRFLSALNAAQNP